MGEYCGEKKKLRAKFIILKNRCNWIGAGSFTKYTHTTIANITNTNTDANTSAKEFEIWLRLWISLGTGARNAYLISHQVTALDLNRVYTIFARIQMGPNKECSIGCGAENLTRINI